jgi:succinyl-diaminopimelate desuccinylase
VSPTLELALDLIGRQTVSPEDGGCQDVIAARLRRAGFAVEPLPFGAVKNLWAIRGDTGPVLCFAGHTDVVPPGPLEQWNSDPFRPEIRAGVLYGRGAADMKTGLAAMVTATEDFLAAHPEPAGRIAFLLTSDEEGPAVDGTSRVVDALVARGQRIDWCLVGEPSSENTFGDTIKIGRRGSLSARVTVHGIQGHVAYPEQANNPIHAFAPALTELSRREWDRGWERFGPTTFQVSNLNAGTGAPNVIPGELKVRFNLRWSPAQSVAGLKSTVQEILDRHGLNYSIEWYVAGEPFFTSPGAYSDAVASAVADVTSTQPRLSTGGGTSDGRFIARTGAQIVEFGATNRSIHKVNECVAVEEIDLLRRCYLRILERLLAKGGA